MMNIVWKFMDFNCQNFGTSRLYKKEKFEKSKVFLPQLAKKWYCIMEYWDIRKTPTVLKGNWKIEQYFYEIKANWRFNKQNRTN